MAEFQESRRAGRPWATLRGTSQELNEIAQALRGWLDDAGITVAVLHTRLTHDHFPDRVIPAQRKLYDFCAGKDLSWAFVEAVADVCTPGDATAQQQKLQRVSHMWDAARTNPTPVGQGLGTPGRELLEAKDRIIVAYEQIDRLRQAQADSEQARARAEQLVMMLLSMLGQLFAKVGDLTQDRNRLLAERSPDPAALTTAEDRLREATGHREETEEALRRAERERDEALRVADEARRVAQRLQGELDRATAGRNGPSDPLAGEPNSHATSSIPAAPDADELFLQDYTEALRKAHTVLDTGNDAIQAAEQQIAEITAVLPPGTGNVIPGTVLSRTTQDNTVTGVDAVFEDRYREYLARKHGYLTIFGVDLVRRWPLDLAYLSLEVAGSAPGFVERVEQALAGRQRTVVMGTAGSGKTTLLQWLAVNAARRTLPGQLEHLNGSVPFVVPLRQLANHDAFPGAEQLLAAVSYPLASEQPEGWASRIFQHGRAFVLIDGVDEIDPKRRARTRAWLEGMLAEHPRGCYVVTTRAASVPLDWLDSVGFRHLTLRPMSPDDARSSIHLWHTAARAEADEEERSNLEALETAVQNSVRQDRNLASLATTPLLCALLCALNRDRRGYLPHSRMSLYHAALSMLLVRRDTERGIGAVEGLRITEHESMQLLQTLAYWLRRNDLSQTDMATATRVLRPVVEAMPAIQGSDDGQVLQHLLVRSGLLRSPAANQLEFTHSTFQDYLSARAAVEHADFGLLVRKAHEEQWENTVKMAVSHARPQERAQLLEALVNRGDQEELHREQLHQLAAYCLEYAIELSPEVREMVLQRVTERDQ